MDSSKLLLTQKILVKPKLLLNPMNHKKIHGEKTSRHGDKNIGKGGVRVVHVNCMHV